MTPHPPDPDLFSAAWAAYRAVVEHDYLWHRMAGAALRWLIDRRFGPDAPVRFLDLACGDAGPACQLLAGRPLAGYVGVDRSGPALAAAAANVRELGAAAELVAADFVDYLEGAAERFDVVYVGLSAHHLGEDRLPRLFAAVRRCLTPGGLFAAYEPFTLPDETRDEHVERLCAVMDHFWVKMSADQRGLVMDHIRANDLPVPLTRWESLAAAAGLGPARVPMKSPDRLCLLVAHAPAR